MPITQKQQVGKLGEDIACKYLEKQGYNIVERNYWKKFGEIDVIAEKCRVLHFIEVKSVSRKIFGTSVTHETKKRHGDDEHKPEDNLHPWKLKRFGRAIQVYLEERCVSREICWQVDAITVLIDHSKRIGRVNIFENIVI